MRPSEKNYYQFTFQINLHVDDVGVLNYIRDTLGFGTVQLSKKSPVASFIVRSLDDVKVIISLFSSLCDPAKLKKCASPEVCTERSVGARET